MLDAKIRDKAVSLVTRAKAYNAQFEVCWHGHPTYGFLCGIRGFDSQYGEPVECIGCELGDDEPPFEPHKLYAWALATARGQKWVDSEPSSTGAWVGEGSWDDYEVSLWSGGSEHGTVR